MPVWCWETLAVRDTHRGHHYGTQFTEATIARAADSGVELIYGVCAPSVVGFHQRNGFNAGDLGQTLLDTSPVGVVAPLTADPTNMFVWRLLADTPTVTAEPLAITATEVHTNLGQPLPRN